MPDIISIIVPVYNASKYLTQCIEGILEQTYRDIEIILIDDGSTDSSAQICEKYRKLDGRIQFISQKNGGSVIARKTGLKIARGKYIGFVDADDYIEPDMFKRLYSIMEMFGVDFVHSGMILDNKKICDFEDNLIDFSLLDRAKYIRENIFQKQQIFFALWSKLFKADFIKDAYMQLPDEQSYGEDLLCLCNYIFKCERFYLFKDAYYHYRIHKKSLSHINWLDACLEESKLHSYVIRFLRQNNLMDECGDSAKLYYRRRLITVMMEDESSGIIALKYKFPSVEMLKGKKIALYGAGKVGKDFYCQMVQDKQCEVVVWIDKEKQAISNIISISQPSILKDVDYDIVVIAVKHKEVADEIKAELLQNHICINDSLILWEEPICLW